jgi:hypothetical protein
MIERIFCRHRNGLISGHSIKSGIRHDAPLAMLSTKF